MKKILTIILLLVLLLHAQVYSESIDEIYIYVTLDQYGVANITQYWTGNFDKGTELYIPQTFKGNKFIAEETFHVRQVFGDEEVYFDRIKWDTSLSREEKTNKYGVNFNEDTMELCWGIGEYGYNKYIIDYNIYEAIEGYDDYDGFNIRFINDGLSSPPKDIVVVFEKENGVLTLDDTAMWAFGFKGEILIEDGKVIARNTSPLTDDNHVTIALRFNKGLFSPPITNSGTFDEKILNIALKGSDYEPSFWESLENFIINILLPLTVFIGALIYAIFFHQNGYITFKKKIKKKEIIESSFLPIDVNIPGINIAVSPIKKPALQDLIGAYMLLWLQKKAIIEDVQRDVGFTGKVKETRIFTINFGYHPQELAESLLWGMMLEAAGDGKLSEKEFNKYASKYYKEINSWYEKTIVNEGIEYFIDNQWLESSTKGNDAGRDICIKTIGFGKFLDNFTLIDERGIFEVDLWDSYLIFASVYGIADKVAKQLKNHYPEYYERSGYSSNAVTTAMNLSNSMSRQAMQKIQSERRAGSGGSSSVGGGGGYSGGGSGGGSR